MAQMIRKQIYIQKSQEDRLKKVAEARGVSEAEIIRPRWKTNCAAQGIVLRMMTRRLRRHISLCSPWLNALPSVVRKEIGRAQNFMKNA